MTNNIAKGAIISYVSIFLNIAISFVYTPWMIRQIGVSNYGLYALVTALVSYFLLDFGLNTSITRFIAKYRADGDEQKIGNLIGLISRVYLIIDAIIFVAMFVMYFFLKEIYTGLTSSEIDTLKGLYVIAAFFSLLTFLFKPMDGAMMAYEYFVPNKLLDIIHKLGSVVLIVILLLLGGDVYSLVLVTCATAFLSSLCKYIVFKHKTKLKINWRYYDKDLLKVLIVFSGWVFLLGLAQRFRLSFIPSVLGIVSDSAEISIFSLGMTIEGFVWLIANALNGLFLPKVTRLSTSSKDRSFINNLMLSVGRVQLFIILLIFSGLLLFGDSFVHCWVGEEFSNSYYVILLLVFPNVISTTQSIANDLLYSENKIRNTAPVLFTTSIIGLSCSLFVAREYGAVACAACTCFGMILYLIWLNRFYSNSLNLDITGFFHRCHLDISAKMIITFALGLLIKNILVIDNWTTFIIGVCCYSIIYVINAYFLAFNSDEKMLFKQIFKR